MQTQKLCSRYTNIGELVSEVRKLAPDAQVVLLERRKSRDTTCKHCGQPIATKTLCFHELVRCPFSQIYGMARDAFHPKCFVESHRADTINPNAWIGEWGLLNPDERQQLLALCPHKLDESFCARYLQRKLTWRRRYVDLLETSSRPVSTPNASSRSASSALPTADQDYYTRLFSDELHGVLSTRKELDLDEEKCKTVWRQRFELCGTAFAGKDEYAQNEVLFMSHDFTESRYHDPEFHELYGNKVEADTEDLTPCSLTTVTEPPTDTSSSDQIEPDSTALISETAKVASHSAKFAASSDLLLLQCFRNTFMDLTSETQAAFVKRFVLGRPFSERRLWLDAILPPMSFVLRHSNEHLGDIFASAFDRPDLRVLCKRYTSADTIGKMLLHAQTIQPFEFLSYSVTVHHHYRPFSIREAFARVVQFATAVGRTAKVACLRRLIARRMQVLDEFVAFAELLQNHHFENQQCLRTVMSMLNTDDLPPPKVYMRSDQCNRNIYRENLELPSNRARNTAAGHVAIISRSAAFATSATRNTNRAKVANTASVARRNGSPNGCTTTDKVNAGEESAGRVVAVNSRKTEVCRHVPVRWAAINAVTADTARTNTAASANAASANAATAYADGANVVDTTSTTNVGAVHAVVAEADIVTPDDYHNNYRDNCEDDGCRNVGDNVEGDGDIYVEGVCDDDADVESNSDGDGYSDGDDANCDNDEDEIGTGGGGDGGGVGGSDVGETRCRKRKYTNCQDSSAERLESYTSPGIVERVERVGKPLVRKRYDDAYRNPQNKPFYFMSAIEPKSLTMMFQRAYAAKRWLVERKYAGERVQIHSNRTSDGQLVCFNRTYHPTQSYKLEPLTHAFPEDVLADGFVIDSQFCLSWRDRPQEPVPFITVTHKRIRMLSYTAVPHYFAFDLLAYGGRSLLDEPLYERRRLLRRLLERCDSNIISLAQHWSACDNASDPVPIGDVATLRQLLEDHVLPAQGKIDGLMVKDLDSTYCRTNRVAWYHLRYVAIPRYLTDKFGTIDNSATPLGKRASPDDKLIAACDTASMLRIDGQCEQTNQANRDIEPQIVGEQSTTDPCGAKRPKTDGATERATTECFAVADNYACGAVTADSVASCSDVAVDLGVAGGNEPVVDRDVNTGLAAANAKNLTHVQLNGKGPWFRRVEFDWEQAGLESIYAVVIGAWFGIGQLTGRLSRFLLACWDTELLTWREIAVLRGPVYKSSETALQCPRASTASAERFYDKEDVDRETDVSAQQPEYLLWDKAQLDPSHWTHRARLLKAVDVVVRDPHVNNEVWEIHGIGFKRTRYSNSGIELYVPRVLCLRTDLSVADATTFQSIRERFAFRF